MTDPREEEITGEISENEDVFEVSVEDILGEKLRYGYQSHQQLIRVKYLLL